MANMLEGALETPIGALFSMNESTYEPLERVFYVCFLIFA
jgi:hypothetical protein